MKPWLAWGWGKWLRLQGCVRAVGSWSTLLANFFWGTGREILFAPRVWVSFPGLAGSQRMYELWSKGSLSGNRWKTLPECTAEMPLQALGLPKTSLSTPLWLWAIYGGSNPRPFSGLSASFDASAKPSRGAQQPSLLKAGLPGSENLLQSTCIIKFYLKFSSKIIDLASQILEHCCGPKSWHNTWGLWGTNYTMFSHTGVRV